LTEKLPVRGQPLRADEDPSGVAKAPPALPVHRRLFGGWMVITGRFGFCQTLVILAFFYGLLIGPVALLSALARRDFLGKRGLRAEGSAWLEADSAKPDLERAKLLS
jgi:hypothetical protein